LWRFHPQEDFNQIWIQAFFLKTYESNFLLEKKGENKLLLFLATYFGTKYGNMALLI
jgi:hypothetical protein